uniref:Clp protease N-terminal domain-containing protein n=1 Tax=Elioraea sp. TaxID=2185103 RepID=UPI0025BAE4D1
MAAIDLKALVGRLNDYCRRQLESAAGLTLSRSHYNIEIEHWLLKLLDAQDGDLAAILRHYDVDAGRFSADLTKVLDRLKTGNARAPSVSLDIVELMKQAWLLASLEHGAGRIRSGHLLLALISDETLQRRAAEASSQFGKIPPDALKRDLGAITKDTAEAATATPAPGDAPAAAGGGGGPSARWKS